MRDVSVKLTVWLNAKHPWNILSASVTADVSHGRAVAPVLATSPLLNDSALKNIECMSVTLDVSHDERSALKLVAPKNICLMVLTLDVTHDERSALNEDANANMAIMS